MGDFTSCSRSFFASSLKQFIISASKANKQPTGNKKQQQNQPKQTKCDVELSWGSCRLTFVMWRLKGDSNKRGKLVKIKDEFIFLAAGNDENMICREC